MKEVLIISIIVGAALLYTAGYITGKNDNNIEWKASAIAAGVAHYNPTNAVLEWNTNR